MKKEESSYSAKFWKPKIEEDITFYKAHLENYGFDKHVHDDYTISVIKDGVMDAFMQGKHLHVNNLSIVMLNPDEVHSNASEYKKDYKQYSLYLRPSYMEKLLGMGLEGKEIYFKNHTFENRILATQFISLLERDELHQISKLEFECRFVDLVQELLLKNTALKDLKTLTSHDQMIKRAKEYMNDHYESDFSLEDIARELDISKYHFLRLFKESTFLSPMAYLMARRIEKAKEKLQTGKALIETAHECGFYDQSHLNRRFKSVFGITPKTYQHLFL